MAYKTKEKRNETQSRYQYRVYHENLDEARKKSREKASKFYAKNPGKRREYHLRQKYGISVSQFGKILEIQGGVCAICATDSPGKKGFHVDHDHSTGAVRGVLCSRCNRGLVIFGDNYDGIHRVLTYLKNGAH